MQNNEHENRGEFEISIPEGEGIKPISIINEAGAVVTITINYEAHYSNSYTYNYPDWLGPDVVDKMIDLLSRLTG